MKRILEIFLLISIIGILIISQTGCGGKTEKKPYEILTKTSEVMTLLYFEHTGPYDQIGATLNRLAEYAAKKGVDGNMVGIYLDDPEAVRPESLRSEIGIVVPYGFMPDSGYGIQEIPARKVVYAILKGPYEEIAKEYPYITEWMKEKGYKMSAPITEIYLEAGPNVPPVQLVTEVQFPVE
ncbi:MAG TPA: GyrI-like domain-containing protein [candidate division Zixibacteria bacterium]